MTANPRLADIVGCNKDLPSIDITIGGVEYVIDANSLVLPDGPMCILLMLGMDLHRTLGVRGVRPFPAPLSFETCADRPPPHPTDSRLFCS